MLPAIVTGALSLILVAQTPATQSSKQPQKTPPPCVVSGTVVTAAEGTPLKSAKVALVPEHEGRMSQIYASISDGSGRFTIKEIPAGRYHFFASRAGYVDQGYQSTGQDSGAVLALKAGQEIKDVLFRMTPAS